MPGVTDGIAAALARDAGFSTVYVSGAGTAAARGLPDMSVLSLSELVDAVRVLGAQGVDTVVDLDTGYGGPVPLRRAMRELAAAGAAAAIPMGHPNMINLAAGQAGGRVRGRTAG